MTASTDEQNKTGVGKEGTITFLNSNDVLCGRGSGPNDHVGNVAFRKLVSTRRREYLGTSTRMQKARIAREIADAVWNANPPGRFLEKATETSWNVVPEVKALEKVKQALRQMRHRRAESICLGTPFSKDLILRRRKSAPCIRENFFAEEDMSQRKSFIDNVYTTIAAAKHFTDNVHAIKGNPRGYSTLNGQVGNSFFNQACNAPQNLAPEHFSNMSNPSFDPRLNNVQRVCSTDFIYPNGAIAYAKYDARESSEACNTISPLTTSQVLRMDSQSTSLSTMEPLPFPVTSKSSITTYNSGQSQSIDGDVVLPTGDQDLQIPRNKFVSSEDKNTAFQTSSLSFSSADIEIEPRPFTFQRTTDSADDVTAQQYLNIVDALQDSQGSLPSFS